MDKLPEDMKLELDELDSVTGGLGFDLFRNKDSSPDKPETYTVQDGDSLHTIGEKFNVSTEVLFTLNMLEIIRVANENGKTFLNPIDYANTLFPGTVLRIL